jgi:hypothetical protein
MKQPPTIGNAEQKHFRWRSRWGSLVAIIAASAFLSYIGRFQLHPAVMGALLVILLIATQIPFYWRAHGAVPKEGPGWYFVMVATAGFSMLLFSGRIAHVDMTGVLKGLAFAVPAAAVLWFRWEVAHTRRRKAAEKPVEKSS